MSDNIETIGNNARATHTKCRVAYTINNSQPVACTIIGDQPLFYMDYEGPFEEEGLFDDIDLDVLENELLNLQREMESFDRFSEGFSEAQYNTVENFLSDAEFITIPAGKSESNVKTLLETLSKSRLAKAYIDCAAQYNVEIAYSNQIEHASYERKAGKILINPSLEIADQLLTASRELRRHYQHRQGALIHPLMFHPDNAVLINRAQICDLVVSMVRIAWELQLADEKSAWEKIENSSMADLGRAFAREAYLDFRTINNGAATAAVFEAWFLSERCRAADKTLIQQMLTDNQGYVFDLEEATQNITPTLLSALGEMPFGKNYLAEHALTIMNDPVFSDIRDRSNANFLWFIKFERSFRETEQGLEHKLQPNLHPAASGDRKDAKMNKKDEDYVEFRTQQSAEIITLYADSATDADSKNTGKPQNRLSPKQRSQRNNEKGADIIYLRRWSGE
ncbi:MAG: DUF6782 family putative metallopeptidase [Alphaproteobacteria bacterium]